jgi:hypothetical protein
LCGREPPACRSNESWEEFLEVARCSSRRQSRLAAPNVGRGGEMKGNVVRMVLLLCLGTGAAPAAATGRPDGACLAASAAGLAQGAAARSIGAPPSEWTWERVRERADEVSGARLAIGLDTAGLKRSEARFAAGRLVKTVDPNRAVFLALYGSGGEVRIALTRGRVDVMVSGGGTFTTMATTTDADLLAMRSALALSPTVQGLRAAMARLSSDVAATVEGADLLISNALLASLDGDVSALERVGRRLERWLTTPAAEARLVVATCYDTWKKEAVDAMNWVEQCYYDFAWWNVFMKDLCFVEWTLRVEAAWFEFLRCLALAPRLPGA